MRQRVGYKKILQYRKKTGLPVCAALVRGGTGHRVDLLLPGGKIVNWWPADDEMDHPDMEWDDSSFDYGEITKWSKAQGII